MLGRSRLSSFQYLTYYFAAKSHGTRKKEIRRDTPFFLYFASFATLRGQLPYRTIRSTATRRCWMCPSWTLSVMLAVP